MRALYLSHNMLSTTPERAHTLLVVAVLCERPS